jgi:hypothetical protein
MMSRFNASMRRKAAASSRRDRPGAGALRKRHAMIARPTSMPAHSPATVPQATPATPQPSQRPKAIDSAMLTEFSTS